MAVLAGAKLIYLSVYTTENSSSLLLRECCLRAVQSGCVIITSIDNKSTQKPCYPGAFPETHAATLHPIILPSEYIASENLLRQTIFYADPKYFSESVLSDKIFMCLSNDDKGMSAILHTATVLYLLQQSIDQIDLEAPETDVGTILSTPRIQETQFYLPLPLINSTF